VIAAADRNRNSALKIFVSCETAESRIPVAGKNSANKADWRQIGQASYY
jgi:hypothetical protein